MTNGTDWTTGAGTLGDGFTLVLAQQAGAGAEPVPVGVPQATGGGTVTSQPLPGGTAAPGGTVPQGSPPGSEFMWIMMAVLVVMVVMTTLTGRKERKRRQAMMNSMKKSDKVMTAGGIIGTIAEMTDDEVVLRLEEGKVRVSRASIQAVIKPAVVAAGKAETA